jgi:dihydrofolate reductase
VARARGRGRGRRDLRRAAGRCAQGSRHARRSGPRLRNVEAIDGNLVDAVTALKAQDGVDKILIAGSVSIVRQLLSAGLLDELRLLVHPIAARNGTRLFEEGEPMYPFALLKTESYPSGVVRLVYATAELPTPQSYEEIVENVPAASAE